MYYISDCEQLLCFRYYNGEGEECAAESPALPTKFKVDLKKLPHRLKEGMSRKRSGDHVSPFSYNNESFEMNSENPPRIEFVPGTSHDIKHLSENVNKCSISALESSGKNLEKTNCDPSKSLVSNLSQESQTVNIESRVDSDCKPTSSGVKKKCPPPVDTGSSQALSGVKKKQKGVNSGVDSPTSPGTEYYKIWSPKNPCKIMKFVYDVESANVPNDAEKSPVPPLPPRQSHKPLERMHALSPPQVPRHRKPKKLTKPEDSFTFELIDTDENFFTDNNITNSAVLQGEINDFKPGEFYSGNQIATSSTASFWKSGQNIAPLATPETDGSLCESTISKLSRLHEEKKPKDASQSSPSASRNKILFIKDIGPDNYITTTFARKEKPSPPMDVVDGISRTPNHAKSEEKAQHTFLNEISNHSEFEDDNRNQIEEKEITVLKGHKPLTRQNSGRGNTPTMMTAFLNSSHIDPSTREADNSTSSNAPSSCNSSHSTSPVDESNKMLPSVGTLLMNRKYSCESSTPKHSSLPRHLIKNLGCEGTPKHSPSKTSTSTMESPVRPHPRVLTRVAALAGTAMPQCPPTPTHHARRPRPLPPPDLHPPPIQNSEARLHENFEMVEFTNELRTSEIRSPNMEFVNSNHFTIVHAGPPEDVELRRPRPEDNDDNDNSVASPTPLRHMAGIRLPSIPERASRQMALTGDFPANMIGGIIECEEPLPAGEYLLKIFTFTYY